MTIELSFSEAVPSWTKLGSAEFFRLLEYPKGDESIIAEKANEYGIKWESKILSLKAESELSINSFLTYVANWYTRNKLVSVSNYDLVMKHSGEGNNILFVPTPRPATLRYVPSNSSNIKPAGLKEIDIETLKEPEREYIASIKKNGIDGISSDRIKSAKVYTTERYIEFSVVPTIGKKGRCFACFREDYLMPTKETQSPLTVGLGNYANFYSYHSRNIGFCRMCAISNHLAFGRVLYNVSDKSVFIAIPESSSIQDLVEFIAIIELSYPVTKFIRSVRDLDVADNILISSSRGYFSNFVENGYGSSGFYFLILVLFTALLNSINSLVHDIRDKEVMKDVESNELFNYLMGSLKNKNAYDAISEVFKSWSFILSVGDQHIRYWRYTTSRNVINIIRRMREVCGISNPLGVIQKLLYKSGRNYIDRRREDFSRSLLMGRPEIGILEEAVWEIMTSKGKVMGGISDLAMCVAGKKIGENNMESEEILKQCRIIGSTIAELSAEAKNKGMLYELRSVGNPQAFRSFVERFTFTCASIGKPSSITNEFLAKILNGDGWKAYKSIIAIVANQHYSYLSSKNEVPTQ